MTTTFTPYLHGCPAVRITYSYSKESMLMQKKIERRDGSTAYFIAQLTPAHIAQLEFLEPSQVLCASSIFYDAYENYSCAPSFD